MSILVAGGAGYIGAHVVRLLLERGEEVVVVDDLSYGTPERVKGADVVELDVASGQATEALTEVMSSRGVTAVIHFAARKQVGESVVPWRRSRPRRPPSSSYLMPRVRGFKVRTGDLPYEREALTQGRARRAGLQPVRRGACRTVPRQAAQPVSQMS